MRRKTGYPYTYWHFFRGLEPGGPARRSGALVYAGGMATTRRPTASRPAARRSTAPAKPRKPGAELRFRMRVTVGETIAVGPGKVALLQAIDRAGSITAAAKELDMSYRRAWLLLDELNRSLRVAAVDSAKGGAAGGGSVLTREGRELIALYRRIEATAAAACRSDIRKLMGMLA